MKYIKQSKFLPFIMTLILTMVNITEVKAISINNYQTESHIAALKQVFLLAQKGKVKVKGQLFGIGTDVRTITKKLGKPKKQTATMLHYQDCTFYFGKNKKVSSILIPKTAIGFSNIQYSSGDVKANLGDPIEEISKGDGSGPAFYYIWGTKKLNVQIEFVNKRNMLGLWINGPVKMEEYDPEYNL